MMRKNFIYCSTNSGGGGYWLPEITITVYSEALDPTLIWGSNSGNNVGGMFGPISISGTRKYWQNMTMGGGGGNRSNIANTISNISNVASKATETTGLLLRSTRFGSRIAYDLSDSRVFLNGIKILKPFGYGLSFLSIGTDFYLSETGQQSWGETYTNTAITGVAIIVGGWIGLGIELDYQGAKLYLRSTREHPEWFLPSWYFSR